MKQKFFPYVIALSALLVSGSAAFYSVYGLSKLFAGASTQVIIMAGSLEFAKLVIASLLYQYWDTINRGLKLYLLSATLILMLITSGGIYGFLSGAYQETAIKSEFLDKSLMVIKQKQTRFEETKEDVKLEKEQITNTISNLRESISNPSQVQYVDKESGQLITTTSSSTRRALQSELKVSIIERDRLNVRLISVTDSIASLDMRLLNKEMGNEEQRELGPLKYLAELTGQGMDTVINWFLMLIIFVFDPLAIALVIAANMAFGSLTPKKEEEVSVKTPPRIVPVMGGDKQQSEELTEKVRLSQERLRKIVGKVQMRVSEGSLESPEKDNTIEENNERINIIGQNGNDGLHYDIATPEVVDMTSSINNPNEIKDEMVEDDKLEDTPSDVKVNGWVGRVSYVNSREYGDK
tara:strand:- start:2252 stop:3478 length:1227 start_codon:yes stop_codon:yes gene_type:complete